MKAYMSIRLICKPCRLDELRGSDLRVGVLDDAGELVPVASAVEPDAEPAAMTDVRRHEEALPVGFHHHRLATLGRGAPDREAAVAVMVGKHHQERLLAPHEERRSPVAQALRRLRQP